MASDFSVLAPVYDQMGLAQFAQEMTPKLINYAQVQDWLGRRILELGCGTGGASIWFAEHGYFVIGVDNSTQMLAVLRQGLGANLPNSNLIEADVRELTSLSEDFESADMAFSIGLMNTLANLRDLELVIKGVSRTLGSGKYFVFDLHTIQGLVRRSGQADELVVDEPGLTVFSSVTFDYDRQIQTTTYHIFQRDGGIWQRSKAIIQLRAYPIQAVATLLKRYQFEIVGLLDRDMNDVSVAHPDAERVVFVLKKAEQG